MHRTSGRATRLLAIAATVLAGTMTGLTSTVVAATAPPDARGAVSRSVDVSGIRPAGADERARPGANYGGLRIGPGCKGGFVLVNADAGSSRATGATCTHGPDAAGAGVDVTERPTVEALREEAAATEAGTVPCTGDGTSGPRVQVVYAVASDRPDRFGSVLGMLRGYAATVDQVFVNSAARDGGVRHVRWVTGAGCTLDVAHAVLSAAGDDSLSNTRSELKQLGYNRTDRKYLVFADATVYCGIANAVGDARPDLTNPANSGPTFARVDSACWGATTSVAAHEVAHTLGAVQLAAPHASGSWHCTDESDRLCYSDAAGVTMAFPCPTSQESLFDCNGDDYFNVAPRAGSWLSGHWNLANSIFLDGAEPVAAPTAPTMPTASISVSDSYVVEGQTGTRSLVFPVTLSTAPPQGTTVSVKVATSEGTAAKTVDYTSYSGTVTFGQGETTRSVMVAVRGDSVDEPNETLKLKLSKASGAGLADTVAVGTIVDDDGGPTTLPKPSLYVSDVLIPWAASGNSLGDVVVSLSRASTTPVTVKIATVDGTAFAGIDYLGLPTALITLAPGQTSQRVTLTAHGGTATTLPASFQAKLSGASGAVFGDQSGVATIVRP